MSHVKTFGLIILSVFVFFGGNSVVVAENVPLRPARIGGTVTVDRVKLKQRDAEGYKFIVTDIDGNPFDPPAQDTDGLNIYGLYTVNIPLGFFSDNKGVRPNSFARINAYRNGTELRVLKPVNGEFQIGLGGTVVQIDLTLQTPERENHHNYFADLYARGLIAPKRMSIYWPERVVKELRIKPGMTILDIGAGVGLFTFPMAEALKGTGKVYATEINPIRLGYLKKKATERNLANVSPVLVSSHGLDKFYRNKSFDIIVVCAVYGGLAKPEDYFRELAPSLKKDSGRLIIIAFRPEPRFTAIHFPEFEKMLEKLSDRGNEFPVIRRLSPECRRFLVMWDRSEVPATIQNRIIQDFNNMLDDRYLLVDLIEYAERTTGVRACLDSIATEHLDRRLAQWLITRLDENGVFSEQALVLSDLDKKRLRMLNDIFLRGFLKPLETRKLTLSDFLIFVGKRRLIKTIENSGYKLVCERNFLPQHSYFEFKRTR